METHNSENHIKYRDYTLELYKNQKMEIIHNTYKHQRQNINYKFNSYLI
jgi:hypothetical protein